MVLGDQEIVDRVIGLLNEKFPHTFYRYENRRRPLKIGIHLDILAVLDGVVTPSELRLALRVYTSNKVYRARLRAGATRIDLAGKPAGQVTEPAKPPRAAQRMSLVDLKAAAQRRKQQQ